MMMMMMMMMADTIDFFVLLIIISRFILFFIRLLVKPMEKYKTRLSIGISTLTSFYTIVLKPMESIQKY